MKFPILQKGLAIGAVTVGLVVSLSMVQDIVQERQSRQYEAEQNIADSLAGSQSLLGPVISRVCKETWTGYNDEKPAKAIVNVDTMSVNFTPKVMSVDTKVEMSPRYRGLFKVNGYVSKSKISVQWSNFSGITPKPEHDNGSVTCDEPILSIALSDPRGIRSAVLSVDGKPAVITPGSGLNQNPKGIQATLPLASLKVDQGLTAELQLEINGTKALSVVPVADDTTVKLSGDWPHPAFTGQFLPSERQITPTGFDANWKISALASTAPDQWFKGGRLCTLQSGSYETYTAVEAAAAAAEPGGSCLESFGVSFIDPVNPYVLSDRATKYGMLFIIITFVGVGLVEVLRRMRVHPMQYLLVGAALTTFFLLLTSLSEHIAFNLAYLIASSACTLLLSFYGMFVLKGWRSGFLFGLSIGSLFGALFVLLQLEQTALLLGAIMLFVILAIVMISTRHVDWYDLLDQMRGSQKKQVTTPTTLQSE